MSIPVLMYHHVLPKDSFITSSIENFEKQMKYLSDNNYKTLTSDEFYRFKKGDFKAPKKSVFITFDDGWRDNIVYAYPILKKYNLKATIFLVTEWINKASEKKEEFISSKHNFCKKIVQTNPAKVVMNWDEIEKCKDIFDYHSHTATHRDFYYEKLSWQEDLAQSYKTIEQRLGIKEKHLCWPRGKFNDKLIKLAQEIGYEILYTTKRGINLPNNNLLHINRLAVKKDEKWLRKNMIIFSNNIMGKLYAKIKPE